LRFFEVLRILVCLHFTIGFKSFLDVSLLYLYKDYLHLEPGQVQLFMAAIAFPHSPKLIYGLLSDNMEVMGSKRRGHLLMNHWICIAAMLLLLAVGSVHDRSGLGKYLITACMVISQMTAAYNDTVIDAMII
jgi:hypothetical protein